MSSNVLDDKVLLFDEADEVLDTRRYYVAKYYGDRAAADAAFLASWDQIGRRLAFEAMWNHGTTIVYGALNGGGFGVPAYGTTCLVVAPQPGDPVAVFPDNTALRYADEQDVVDEDRAIEEPTPWPARGALAALHRSVEAQGRPEAEWPDVLCRDHHFLEVTWVGTLPLSRLEEVRLPTDLYERLADDEALGWLFDMGDALSPSATKASSWTRSAVAPRPRRSGRKRARSTLKLLTPPPAT